MCGSPPASSTVTVCPASARRAATVPPPAPDPTTTYSLASLAILFSRDGSETPESAQCTRAPPSCSEGFQEGDQRALIGVGQAGELITLIGAEIMPAIDDEI